MKSSTVGRPRSHGRRDLPDNLIPRHRKSGGRDVVYWYWRDPRDGKEKPLQCPGDKATAIRRAKELNALVARELADTIVSNIIAPAHNPRCSTIDVPFNAWAIHCLSLAEKRDLAANTMRTRKSQTNAVANWFGDTPLHQISVPDIVALIEHYTAQGKNRMAQGIRSLLIDIWNDAKAAGKLPAAHPNPAEIARRPTAKTQRARLTLEAFLAILDAAKTLAPKRGEWIYNSMILALVTGQRREDLAIAQFRRGRDWEAAWMAHQLGEKHSIHPYPHADDGHLWVIQQKTGGMVKIPLDLRLDIIDISVHEAINNCRSSIATRHLLHHTAPFGNAPLGSSVHKDTISRAFADARALTDLQWLGKEPPTFHEIRSLSERLYKAQGINTKDLLGHRHERMTEVYHDARQAEWTEVSSNKDRSAGSEL